MRKKTLDNSLAGDRIKVIMNALAKVKRSIRYCIARIIAMQNFDGCKSDDKTEAYIVALGNISDLEICNSIGHYLEKGTLDKCQDGSQVKLIIETLEKIGDGEKIKRIGTLINHKNYLQTYKDGNQIKELIEKIAEQL